MILDVQLCIGTAPESAAADLARTLVEEELCACVNLIPGARSIYRWQGKIEDDSEVLLFFKTTSRRALALRDRWVALHPYDNPEFIVVPVEGGHLDYLQWVVSNCHTTNGKEKAHSQGGDAPC